MHGKEGEKMRRLVSFAVIGLAAAILGLTGCSGPAGDVFLSFDWTYAPDSFYTTDPHLPTTITRTIDYADAEGTYYFEYFHYVSGYLRWLTYTLTAHEGKLLVFPGKDARFQIYCWSFYDPEFTQLQNVESEGGSVPALTTRQAGAAPTEGNRVKQYEYTETAGDYELHVEGGVIEPAR
jgi:hypothetical protein